jgi:hypothetical protein
MNVLELMQIEAAHQNWLLLLDDTLSLLLQLENEGCAPIGGFLSTSQPE